MTNSQQQMARPSSEGARLAHPQRGRRPDGQREVVDCSKAAVGSCCPEESARCHGSEAGPGTPGGCRGAPGSGRRWGRGRLHCGFCGKGWGHRGRRLGQFPWAQAVQCCLVSGPEVAGAGAWWPGRGWQGGPLGWTASESLALLELFPSSRPGWPWGDTACKSAGPWGGSTSGQKVRLSLSEDQRLCDTAAVTRC